MIDYKFEFQHINKDGSKETLEMRGRSEFMPEVIKRLDLMRRHWASDDVIKGIVLGPEEYLGCFGVMLQTNGLDITKVNRIETLMGFPCYLKDSPGIDILLNPSVTNAACASEKFKILKVLKK